MIAAATNTSVLVRSPQAGALAERLAAAGAQISRQNDGALSILGPSAADIGELAAAARITLHELTPQTASLEEAYLTLTQHDVEYATGVHQGA